LPAENLVAAAAPATIDAVAGGGLYQAAIYFPFSDLMVADPYGDIAKGLERVLQGSRVIGGTTTDMR
jgi:hypothetical protein